MTQRVVNYTYGTGNPVLPNGSIDVRDGIDNLQSLDIFMNAPEDTYNQRDGEIVRTVTGMNNEFDSQILNMGFTRIGTFAAGATITNPRQTLLWDVADGGDGQEYGWSGAFPKVVPPTSNPSSTGGIAVGAWISRFDSEFRSDWEGFTSVLLSQAELVDSGLPDTPAHSKRVDAINLIILKNTYNLNPIGSFTNGLTFTSFDDVALYGGMYYMPYGNVTFPLTVASAVPDPLIFKCCGELKGYLINDIRNFGAKPYPAYSHDAINLAIKFINPYVWRGSISNTYTNGPCGDGTVIVPAGWWRCGDKIYHNPGVRLKGVSPARRIYGRNTPKDNLLGSVIFGDSATFKPTYLIDTANYKNDGTRLYASSNFITAVNIDVDGLYAASEGSMLEDLYVIHGQGFFGGFRQHWAMRGGYRNVAVSGFKCNASCNQMWNQITNGLWSEESDIPLMIAETTTQVFDGHHTLLGKGPTAPADYIGFPSFLSGTAEDGNTLATGQKLVSRCLLVAYCEHPVFTALVTEYAANPILVRDTRCLTLNNYHEEANGIVGWTGYKSVVAGWASKVEVKCATSLSNIPFFAMGSGSKGSLTDTVQQNGASQSNTCFTSAPMKLTLDTDVLPAEIIRGGEVIFLRNKPTIYVKVDGNANVYGHNTAQPTTIDSALKHLSTSGIIDANIVLLGDVIRNAGGFGVFGALSISGAFAFTHAASAPEFTISAKSISKQGISEYMNSAGFTLEGRHTDITHKNTLTTGAHSAYSIPASAHTLRFVSENANVGTTIFNNSTGKVSISGASLSGGITAGNLVTTAGNAAISFVY